MKIKRYLLGAICIFASVPAVRAGVVNVPVYQIGRFGQTVVSRSRLAYTGDFTSILVNSSRNAGGSAGVWSGVDVDFVLLSTSPVLNDSSATLIKPDLGPGTFVIQGSKRSGAPYATKKHPGRLFGLNPDGTIDHGTASLHAMDAKYPYYQLPGTSLIDSSTGWVTLGDGGRLVADVGLVSGTFYVFLGEAATSGEPATVQLTQPDPIPEPAGLSLLGAGSLAALARRRKKIRAR
jgi:hypothetical protein